MNVILIGLQASYEFGFGAVDSNAIFTRQRQQNIPVTGRSEDGVQGVQTPSLLRRFFKFLVNFFVVGFSSLYETLTHDPPLGKFLDQSVPIMQLSDNIKHGMLYTHVFVVNSDITFLEEVVLVFSMSFVNTSQDDYNQFIDDYYHNGADVTWPKRGQVEVKLESPSGTVSTLIPYRRSDIFPGTYDNWSFSSVHFWGENPTGIWTIFINFIGSVGTISVQVPKMTLYGLSQVASKIVIDSEGSFCDTISAVHNLRVDSKLTTHLCNYVFSHSIKTSYVGANSYSPLLCFVHGFTYYFFARRLIFHEVLFHKKCFSMEGLQFFKDSEFNF